MTKKILWVEDQTTSIVNYVEAIKEKWRKDIKHKFCRTLDDAISNAKDDYDLIVIDLNFYGKLPVELRFEDIPDKPDHNQGQFFARWLDKNKPDTRYIFLTAVKRAYIKGINKDISDEDICDKNEILPSQFVEKISSLFPDLPKRNDDGKVE